MQKKLCLVVGLFMFTTCMVFSFSGNDNFDEKMTISVGGSEAQALGPQKRWFCVCQLYKDSNGSHAGEWRGSVTVSKIKPRNFVETASANSQCEKKTARRAVNCKNCSCSSQ